VVGAEIARRIATSEKRRASAVIQAIPGARTGRPSENAEYDRQGKQGFIEGRIADLEASWPMRRSSTRPADAEGRIVFGATVGLEVSIPASP
jgi:transcription elongation GreA/GreB family factor